MTEPTKLVDLESFEYWEATPVQVLEMMVELRKLRAENARLLHERGAAYNDVAALKLEVERLKQNILVWTDTLRDIKREGHAVIDELRTKLTALEKLRDEVEPVLRFYAERPAEDYQAALNEHVDIGQKARAILARHYDKKEPTK